MIDKYVGPHTITFTYVPKHGPVVEGLLTGLHAVGPLGAVIILFVLAQLAQGAYWASVRREGRDRVSAPGRHRA